MLSFILEVENIKQSCPCPHSAGVPISEGIRMGNAISLFQSHSKCPTITGAIAGVIKTRDIGSKLNTATQSLLFNQFKLMDGTPKENGSLEQTGCMQR